MMEGGSTKSVAKSESRVKILDINEILNKTDLNEYGLVISKVETIDNWEEENSQEATFSSDFSNTSSQMKQEQGFENDSFTSETQCIESFNPEDYIVQHTQYSQNDIQQKDSYIFSDSNTNSSNREKSQAQYICFICNKNFQKKGHLHDHMRIHTGEKPFECNICLKRYRQKSHLTQHMTIHTGLKKKLPDILTDSIECEICEEKFGNKSLLIAHHNSYHNAETEFSCIICKKRFTSKNHLTSHMLIHTAEKTHECPTCNKTFRRRYHLTQHMLIHTGEKKYECNICHKKLSQKGHYDEHMLKHTGKKLFECHVCHKMLGTKYTLKYHMSMHPGEKSNIE